MPPLKNKITKQSARLYGRRLEVLLLADSFPAIHRMIEDAEWEAMHETNAPMSRMELLASHVDSAGFSMRFANAISRRGIETIQELLETPEEELLAMREVGESSIKAMYKRLKELGFHG